MKRKEFSEIMISQGLQVKDRFAFGNIKGYPVFVKGKKSHKEVIEIFYALEENPWQEIREEILKLAESKKAKAIFENNQVKITMSLQEKTKIEDFREVMQNIVEILHKKEVKAPEKCILCGEKNCDVFAVIGQGNRPVHRACLQEHMNGIREKMQSGYYTTGILGAFLGMLVGIIPSVLSLLITGEAISALFLLIPLSIYFGYKILGGRMDRFVLYFTILLSLGSVYLIQIVVQIMYNLNREGLGFSWHNGVVIFKKLLSVEDIWITMTQASSLNFLFITVGILIAWEQISQTHKKADENLSEVIDTITSNPNYKDV